MTGAHRAVKDESRSVVKRDRVKSAHAPRADESIEAAPATERMTRPSTRISATMSIAPSISLEAAAPATRAQMTDFLASLGVSHTKLDLSLAYLEKLSTAVCSRDAMSRTAGETITLHALEVAELRDALGRVVVAVDDPNVALLLAPGTTLSSYVKMVYWWSGQIVDALIAFASSAMTGEPAWTELDTRMAETAQFQMRPLTEQIRHEAGAFGIFSEFGETLDELFWAAFYLHKSISKAVEGYIV